MLKKLLLFICLPALAFAQDAPKPINIDRIIAKVDNYIVLRSEVEQLYARSKQQQQPITKCQALESMVVNKLLVAKAEIDSVLVDEKTVDDQLTARMQQMIQLYGNEKNIVDQFGKTLETLKGEVRSQVKEQLTAQKMQQEITKSLKVTPNEVKKFFNQIPKDSIPEIPSEVQIGHIVRYAKVTKAQKEELSARLLDYKRRILAGEKFEDLAKEYSEDPGSRQYGGDLGWSKRGQMVPQFEAAAMKLKANEMTDVVESDFGLHLIQTLEIRGQEYHARHILLRPDYNRLDLTEPNKFLDSLRKEIVRDSITFEKAAKDFSDDKQTQDAGGMISDPQTGASKLPLDQSMDPTLYFTIDSMKVGTITAPMAYRSEDGKTGARIIFYKAKYAPHIANLKDDFEKIKDFALMEKRSKEIESWFKKAIADVYIKIDPEFEACNIFGQMRPNN